MSTRHVFCATLSLSLFVGLCSLATAQSTLTIPNEQELEKLSIEDLTNQIRRDKFDVVLPQIMRENNIDMWIQVMREGNPDPMALELGSNNGVFIFTDRGNDRIERAVFGHSSDLVRECGAYDIVAKPEIRIPLTGLPESRIRLRDFYEKGGTEWPGGPKTELDSRFRGVGEFVAERNPRCIGVNYLEKLGSPVFYEIPWLRSDGISHADYNLLVKALGDKYAKRIVSAEYLITDYLSRPVQSEIVMFKKIRKWITESLERDFDKIVPGVTRFGDLEGGRSIVDKDGNRRRGDYVIQRGDLIKMGGGKQSGYMDLNKFSRGRDQVGVLDFSKWKFGPFYEVVHEFGYVLREGETELPPKIKKAWADVMKVRKVLEDNIKVGLTAGETFEILKRKVEEAGYIYVNRQRFNKDLDPEKTQVPLDLHAAGGMYAPRIGPLGAKWQWDITLQLYHHFYMEYWVYVPMPEWGEGGYLSLQFHDGAIVTEHGVEYIYPPPLRLHIIQ